MAGRVENINPEILQKCREQIGLEICEVQKYIGKISEIEGGTYKPTFKQIDLLSDLYKVPRWVFISKELPEKYRFDQSIPVFRQFSKSNTDIFSDAKIRSVIAKIEYLRELIIDILDDMGETFSDFKAPDISNINDPISCAKKIREWLDKPNEKLLFSEWKELIEGKGIFIFLTSKYKGWSHIDKMVLRGMTIYHVKLPIIIINDSDSKKAQSFTLFHELGHLLRRENAIDDWNYQSKQIESWSDNLAGNILMPEDQIKDAKNEINNLGGIKKIASEFKVSAYACLVRLRQLSYIDIEAYNSYENKLNIEYEQLQKKLKESQGGPSRDRVKEVLTQYGSIYTNVLFQAYHNQEIGLHKLAKLFDLKRPSYVLEMEKQL